MAALAALAIPALKALGIGALSGVGSSIVKKIIGDAVPEDQLGPMLAIGLGDQADPLVSASFSPSQLASLQSVKQSMGTSPEAWFTPQALAFQDGGMLMNPQVRNHSNQVMQSQQTQNIADSAAMLQIPSTQMAIGQSHQMRMQPHQAISAWDVRSQNPGLLNVQNSPSLAISSLAQQQRWGQPLQTSLSQAEMAPLDTNRTVQAVMENPTTSTRLSTHPETGQLIANQPTNKLLNNQGTILEPPNPAGGGNPIAMGVTGTNANPGVQSTLQTQGNNMLNTLKSVGNDAAAGAINQVGGVAQNIATQGLKKAGTYLGNLISSSLSGLAKKIIGDAPPASLKGQMEYKPSYVGYQPLTVRDTTAGIGAFDHLAPYGGIPGVVSDVASKIVGDAPPGDAQGEVMTVDQQTAAVANLQESVVFNMMSRVVLNEQVLVQSTSMPIGLNEAELNNYFARDLEALVGTYRQSEVQTLFGLKGMGCQFFVRPSVTVKNTPTPGDMNFTGYATNTLFCTGVVLESSRVAPPLSTNETLTRLGPLLAGAALGEYSSQLRVKTYSTDVDLMMRATASTINNIQSQTGYSFCLPLVKAVGYLLMHTMLQGDELNEFGPDMYWTLQQGEDWLPWGRFFPLSPHTGNNIWNNSWEGAKLAVLSEANFIKAVTGVLATSTWDDLSPPTWGVTTAIVFIPQNDTTNAVMNSVRMIMQLAFPVGFVAAKGRLSTYVRDGGFITIIPSDNVATKNVCCTHIPGPVSNVIFVVMNAREDAGVGVVIGDGEGAGEDHMVSLNAADHSPQTPLEIGAGETGASRSLAAAMSKDNMYMLIQYIKEWEYSFGNSSDRSSALRFWADHAYLYNATFFGHNGWDVGSPQTISFHTYHSKTAIGGKSAYADYSDVPLAWANGAKYISQAVWLGLMGASRTATLLSPARLDLPDEASKGYKWSNGSAPDASRLPYEDYMVSFLVLKRWVTCNEEYPAVSLNDPARIAHTILVMSNLMATVADLTCQQSDFHSSEVWCSPLILAASPASALRCKSILWPSLEQILTNGIQYPQYWNNRDFNMHCYENLVYWTVTYPLVYPGDVVTCASLASTARIPSSISGQWYKPLYPQYIHLRLNLREMQPQRVYATIDGVRRLIHQAFYSEEQTGLVGRALAPISWLVWRLSQGVIMGTASGNHGFFSQVTNNMDIREYYLHIEQYDASRNQILVREYGVGNVVIPPTTAAALPTGEFLIKRSVTDGLQPVTIVMQGPRDAFIGVGIGSTAYQLFVQTNSPQALFVSESWATVPDWLFADRGLLSDRDTI